MTEMHTAGIWDPILDNYHLNLQYLTPAALPLPVMCVDIAIHATSNIQALQTLIYKLYIKYVQLTASVNLFRLCMSLKVDSVGRSLM